MIFGRPHWSSLLNKVLGADFGTKQCLIILKHDFLFSGTIQGSLPKLKD